LLVLPTAVFNLCPRLPGILMLLTRSTLIARRSFLSWVSLDWSLRWRHPLVEAYNRLNPQFQTSREALEAAHLGFKQTVYARSAGGHVRRALIDSLHPVVQVPSVTCETALSRLLGILWSSKEEPSAVKVPV